MSESDVQRMLALETDPRNAVLLRLIYAAGLRISEACGLRWRDLTERDDAGQVSAFGKGGKTRVVRLPAPVWNRLMALRGDAGQMHRCSSPAKVDTWTRRRCIGS